MSTDLLQHDALLSYDDSLVGVPLTYDCRIDINQTAIRSLFHGINHHCNTMGNLFIKLTECLLPDEFGNYLSLRLVSDRVLIIILWSIRKILHNGIYELICVLAL